MTNENNPNPNDISADSKPWLKVLIALIPATAVLLVGYWQFKPGVEPDKNFAGRITDAKTEQELRKVEVILEAADGTNSPAILTDANGKFSFPIKNLDKPVRVRAKMPGYQPFDRIITPSAKSGVEEIQLSPTKGTTQEVEERTREKINNDSNKTDSSKTDIRVVNESGNIQIDNSDRVTGNTSPAEVSSNTSSKVSPHSPQVSTSIPTPVPSPESTDLKINSETLVFSKDNPIRTVQGQVNANLVQRYSVHLEVGQIATVTLLEGAVKFDVSRPTQEFAALGREKFWEENIKERGEYNIDVVGEKPTSFTMKIQVRRL